MDRAKGAGVLVIHRVPPYPRLPAFSGLIYAAAATRAGLSQAHAERAGSEGPYMHMQGQVPSSVGKPLCLPGVRCFFPVSGHSSATTYRRQRLLRAERIEREGHVSSTKFDTAPRSFTDILPLGAHRIFVPSRTRRYLWNSCTARKRFPSILSSSWAPGPSHNRASSSLVNRGALTDVHSTSWLEQVTRDASHDSCRLDVSGQSSASLIDKSIDDNCLSTIMAPA